MTRQAYFDRDRRFVFFWSPKAGNTSLADWLLRGLWPDLHSASDGTSARGILSRTGHLSRKGEALRLVLDEGFDSFALVRDPFTRAASAFFSKFLFKGDQPLSSFQDLEGFAQKAYLEISGRDRDAPYVGVSFLDYLHYVRARVAMRDPEPDLNPHWNTQVPYQYRAIAFEYGRLVHLECLEAELAPIAQRLGITADFPTLRHRRMPPMARSDLADTPSVELVRDGLTPGVDSLLVPAARALIAEAYEIDFTTLGYPINGPAIDRP